MSDNREEGFSYESPEKQKKNAARLLVIETIALLFVLAGIVSVLFYLGIIKIPSINNNENSIINYIGQKGRLPAPNNTRNTEKTNVSPSVTLVSDDPQMEIKEKEPKRVLEFIKTYDVFGRKYLLRPGEFSDFLQKIEIHLTNVVQPSNKFFMGKTSPISSSNFSFLGNTLKINVQLSDEAFESQKVTPETYFMQSLLFDVYNMSKDPSGIGLTKEQKDDLKSQMDKMYSESKNYVVITHK